MTIRIILPQFKHVSTTRLKRSSYIILIYCGSLWGFLFVLCLPKPPMVVLCLCAAICHKIHWQLLNFTASGYGLRQCSTCLKILSMRFSVIFGQKKDAETLQEAETEQRTHYSATRKSGNHSTMLGCDRRICEYRCNHLGIAPVDRNVILHADLAPV